jgi:MFS family permease
MSPIVGGLITQTFGWQWAFYINLPIGAVTIAAVATVIEDSRDPKVSCRRKLPKTVLIFEIRRFQLALEFLLCDKVGAKLSFWRAGLSRCVFSS